MTAIWKIRRDYENWWPVIDMHEKVLNMTQIKVTAFYIFLELKIRSIFQKVYETVRGDQSFKIIQENSRAFMGLKINIFLWNFWENFEKIFSKFQVHSKIFQDAYSRGESLDVTIEYIKINYSKIIITHALGSCSK